MRLTDINAVKELLACHGFRFSKSMGQNFLTAQWVPERFAAEAGLDRNTGVLEVGPGVGCLTAELSALAGRVVAVELDRALAPVLAETLAGFDNVETVFGDALKMDLKALAGERLAGLRPVVCANLPYNITSPLLSAFIDAGCFESIVVMVQREVARRICASAGTADYGAFTVYACWHYEPEILFDVPPDCFIPRPKVTSSVMRLTRRTAPPAKVGDEAMLFRVVRAAFNQRRKTLVNALSAGLGAYTKQELERAVTDVGLDPLVRGEALDIPAFAALADRLTACRPQS